MAVNLAKEMKVGAVKKRMVDHQVHCVNVPADTTFDYFEQAVTIPFLDQLLGKVQTPFSEGNLDILDMMYGMPTSVDSDSNWKDNFLQSLKKYLDNLPDTDFLHCKLCMW